MTVDDDAATMTGPERIPPAPWAKRVKNTLIYYGVRGVLGFVNSAPRELALDLVGTLALLAYGCASGTRRRTLAQLSHAFSHTLNPAEITHLARAVFWNLGRNTVDALRMGQITTANIDTLVTARGMEHLEAAYRQGRGVLAVSGHIGNFELLGSYLALKGYPVTVVVAKLYDPRLDLLLRNNRALGGLNIVDRDRATGAVVRALRQGHIVGLLVDQDTRVTGVFTPFFGRPAYTPIGPAVLAGRTGAPIVPMAIRRLKDDTHLITIRPPLPLPGEPGSENAIREIVGQYTSAIEQFIRDDPAQWVWMHDRWKTQPDPG